MSQPAQLYTPMPNNPTLIFHPPNGPPVHNERPHQYPTEQFKGNTHIFAMRNFWIRIFALLAPPLSVCILTNDLNADVTINILLTIFGYLPGIIHALWLFHVYKKRRAAFRAKLSVPAQRGVWSRRVLLGGFSTDMGPDGNSSSSVNLV